MDEEIVCPHCGKKVKLRVDADPPSDYLSIEVVKEDSDKGD